MYYCQITTQVNTELCCTASSLDVKLQLLQNVVEQKYSYLGYDFLLTVYTLMSSAFSC